MIIRINIVKHMKHLPGKNIMSAIYRKEEEIPVGITLKFL
jgi:hypothetical protein